MQPAPRWSVVIPTLDEAAELPGCIESARADGPVEVVVSDGGSRDGTRDLARAADRFVFGPAGRGSQLNRGAAAASGDHLLFLHADARLPPGWKTSAESALTDARTSAAAFRIRYDAPGLGFRAIEAFVHLRCRWTGLAFGDHGLAVLRSVFEKAGGFPEVPLMEDVAISRSLRGMGRISLLRQALGVSSRRQGARPLLNAARNQVFLALYFFGVAPETIYRLYYGRTSRGD